MSRLEVQDENTTLSIFQLAQHVRIRVESLLLFRWMGFDLQNECPYLT